MRDEGRLRIELLDEFAQDLFIVFFLGAFQDEIFSADQFTAADEEDLNTGFTIITGHCDHIGIGLIAADHFLAFDDFINRLELVADDSRFFILEIFSSLFHSLIQPFDYGVGATLQKFAKVINDLAIVLLIDCTNTRGCAEFDVVIEASAAVLTGDLPVTGQIGEDLSEQIQCLVDSPYAGIRAEIAPAIIPHLAGYSQFGEGVLPMDFDVGIAFIVFQADIILGPVPLDQRHFEDQRFQFRADHDPLNIGDLMHQAACFSVILGRAVEIGTDPVAQIDGFANVNDLSVAFSSIAARFIRECIENLLDLLTNLHRLSF